MNPLNKLTQHELLSKHSNIFSFALIAAIFYFMTYYSVSDMLPSAIPVHHDDYTNYASSAGSLQWSWIRPMSTAVIYALASWGPEWLIWAVRVLTATYVFLCWKILIEVTRPRQYWITLVLFSLATLSTPIIAEYARYTGMITHMMSGCLGLAAVFFMFKDDRESNDIWLYGSAALLLLSTLAKEDFILFYVFSTAYVLFKSEKPIKKRVLVALAGLVVSLLMVSGAKFLAASSFLGANDAQSSYFIDTSPTGVASTVWRYLTGAGHPAMTYHGKIIAGAMLFSTLVALIALIRDRVLPKTLYMVGVVLTLIAPYSVLPNHVNAYYELIWLPFVIGAVYIALAELIKNKKLQVYQTSFMNIMLALIAASLYILDTPGRYSVAHWYDSMGANNSKVLKYLEENKAAIDAAPSVCVFGANSFSPWYMHSGQYLKTVMDLQTVWHIIIDKKSPLYPGMQLGADASKGNVIIQDVSEMNTECLKLTVGIAQ